MAKTGQGAGKDRTTKPDQPATARAQRGTRPARKHPSTTGQKQRVEFVLALIVNGYAGSRVVQRVAAHHAKEAAARTRHTNEPDAEDLPPLLWGMDDLPPSERSVYVLIKRAKEQLEYEGSVVSRLGDRLMGLQLRRLDAAYRMAVREKKPASMVRVVEVTNDVFAFDGAIRPTLSALTPGGTERTGEREPLPSASMTEDSAVQILAGLIEKGRTNRLAALAHQQVATSDARN